MEVSGNTVLVTGGGSGIGLALTRRLAELGNQVIVCGRSDSSLARARSVPGVVTLRVDLGVASEITTLVSWLRRNHPELNVVVNNAGVMRRHDVRSMGPAGEAWAHASAEVATNLLAPITLSLDLLPDLLERRPAAIVSVTSALAWVPMVGAPVYCASKAALHSFTQSLRDQTRSDGLLVMEVLPPTVDTAMTEGMETHKITPDAMARAIIDGLARDRKEVVIGQARVLRRLATVAPWLARRILAKAG